MNKILALLLLTLTAGLSANAEEVKMPDARALQNNKQLVRKLYEECINPGKLELLDRFIADEYAGARGGKGPSAFAANVVPLRQGFPDIRFTVEDLMEEGDRVTAHWTWKGTHTGTFNGIPASGKPVTNDGIVIYQISDGKIVRAWLQVDRLGVLQQIGLVPNDLTALLASQDVKHISISINRPPREVYEFASRPENLPKWAAGLARSEVRKEWDWWIAESPFGKVRVKFVPKNPYGVLDHDVKLESGVTVHNPMRVVPNGEGSEFTFTLIRQTGVSDEKFADDKAAVEKDLRTLKELLERETSGKPLP